MIDGMTMWLPDDTGRAWRTSKAADELHLEIKDVNTYKGRCDNFIIFENRRGVSISGSVAKYVHGNNLEWCSPDDFALGLDKLGAELHIDLHKAIVSAVEFCVTATFSRPVHEYMAALGSMKQLKVRRYSDPLETVEYSTPHSSRSFKVYDKTKEIADKRGQLPSGYDGNEHVLRLELRIERAYIKKWLGNITPYDLIDDGTAICVCGKLSFLFIDAYDSIEKTGREVLMPNKEHYTVRDIANWAMVWCAQCHSSEFNAQLESLVQTGRFSKDSAKRLRRTLKQSAADSRRVGSNEYIDALMNAGYGGLAKETKAITHCTD